AVPKTGPSSDALTSPVVSIRARSRIWSPIATPARLEVPGVSKIPYGRFWIGKSASGELARATKLVRRGSCVQFRFNTFPPHYPAATTGSESASPRVEVLLDVLPAVRIVRVAETTVRGVGGEALREARFEHESHRVGMTSRGEFDV